MATRLIGVDSTDPRLPDTVIDATAASTAEAGMMYLATEAEAIAGTDETKAMTPAKTKAVLPFVNARSAPFNAVGNGVADDTAALQAWLDYIVANNRTGWLPVGDYRITAALTAPSGFRWGVLGESRFARLIQATPNTPILILGTDATLSVGYGMITLDNFTFRYEAEVSSGDTNANCLVFVSEINYNAFTRLRFDSGYYGMLVPPGSANPWGTKFDELTFGAGLVKGAWDWHNSTVSGEPNNHFGRMTIGCNAMTGPVIHMGGTNTRFDVLEFLTASNSPTLMRILAGSEISIGALKLENGTYNSAASMFLIEGSSTVIVDICHVWGNALTFNPASGQVILFNFASGGGSTAKGLLRIGRLRCQASAAVSNAFAFQASGSVNARIELGDVQLDNGWQLQWTGGTVTADYLTVRNWANGMLAGNKGDADYTVTVGDPTVVPFNTAFTAPRTITLPSQTGNNLHGGLSYKFVFNGAINGANTAVIKQGATTLHTETVDKRAITFTYRRNAWVLTGYETLP